MTLTKHAKLRMSQRQITFQDIYNCVKLGTSQPAKNGLTRYTYQDIYVIIDTNTNKIVTCCFTQSYTKQLKKYAKANCIGFYVAIKMLRSCCNAI
ncbi:MAG TPA: hypothetical protein DEG71_09930 [Clostridiales bacterium]|nr:hypothetical protein [Clostridiales bacterium]